MTIEPKARRRTRLSVRVAGFVLMWAIPLFGGFVAAELYARHVGHYRRWSYPLSKIPFFELDRAKIWNRRYVESSARFFREWPAPIQTFDSDKVTPRFLWQPNIRLIRSGDNLVPAKQGEAPYFSTNSWGFRGAEFALRKPAGVIRVVCLGASTTGGSQGDLETYPYFLQVELNQLFPGHSIEVINAGHHGTSIDDLLEILKARVLPLAPDVVIFYESSNNIDWSEFLTDTSVRCPQEDCWLTQYPVWYRFLYRRSALFTLIADRNGWRSTKAMPHTVSLVGPKVSLIHYRDVLSDIVKETLSNRSKIMLTSFVTIANEGMEVSQKQNLLLFDDMHRKMYPFTPGEVAQVYEVFNQAAAGVASASGVPYADVSTEFPKELRYFSHDYIHFSPEGNRLLAGLLAQKLVKDVLPEVINSAKQNGGL